MTILFFQISALALVAGDPAPDITAKNQQGKPVKLSDYKGKFVLVYFYPKDDTPGCTVQACGLRDNYQKFKDLNVEILGVSRQDEKSHQKFIEKHKLPFDLLVDKDGSIAKAFSVGLIPVVGFTKRESFLIDPAGKIFRVYTDVDPAQHADKVLADVQKK